MSDINKNQSAVSNIPPNQQDDKIDETKKAEIAPFFKLFRFATGADKVLMYIGFFAAFCNGLSLPLFSLVFGDMIDSFDASSNSQKVVDEAGKQAIYFVVLGVISFILSYIQMATWMISGERQGIAYRKEYFKAILRQDVSWFDQINPNQLASKVATECFSIQGAIGEKVPTFIMTLATLLGGFALAFVRGWELSLICTAVLPFIALSAGIFTYQLQNADQLVNNAYRDAGGLAEQAIGGIKTVKSLNGQQFEYKNYDSHLAKAYRIACKYGIYIGMGLGGLWFVMILDYGVGFWFGSLFVGNKTTNDVYDRPYTGGDVIVIFFSIMFGGFSLGQATPCLKSFSQGQQAAFIVFQVLDAKPKISPSIEQGMKPEQIHGNIELKNVNFTYESKPDTQVLKDINIQIQAGKKTALVGESGCGKSTIMQLLERFYDVNSGQVTIDGNNIKDINLKWLRQHVGYVGQEPVLFATSIRDNMKFGKPDATDEEIISALKQANAYDFVMHLQDKLDTFVGQAGSQLSGGQKQRLCIARAILKNPQILLLDEATSALDRRNEKSIQATLDEISKNRTTIVIAHRLSTVQNSDCILVIDNGRLVEQGVHQQLMDKKGKYAALCHNQIQQQQEEEEGQQQVSNDEVNASGSDNEMQGAKIEDTVNKKPHVNPQQSIKNNSSVMVKPGEIAIKAEGEEEKELSKEEKQLIAKKEKEENDIVFKKLYNLNRPERVWMWLGAFFSFVAGACFPFLGVLMAINIDILSKVDITPKDEFKEDNNRNGLYFLILAIVAFVSMTFQFGIWRRVSEGLTMRLRNSTLKKILDMPGYWFDEPDNNPGTLTARLGSDTQLINALTSTIINVQINNTAAFLTGVIIGFVADWRTTLVAFGTFPLMFIAGAIQAQFVQGFSELTDAGYKDSGSIVQESVTNIRTVTSFGNEETIMGTFDDKLKKPLDLISPKAHKSGLSFGFSNIVMYMVFAILFYVSAVFHKEYDTKVVNMFSAIFAIMYSAFGAGNNNQFMVDVGAAYNAAKKLFLVLEADDEIQIHQKTHPETIKSGEIQGNIEFKNVTFKYPSRDKIVLKNISFSINSGQKVAFVGPSGCGKSTIMQLLMRFYEIESGQIFVDGKELHDYDIHFLRSQFGVVSQEPILFQGTIKENIRYNTEGVEMDRIKSAAAQANAATFIEKNEFETNENNPLLDFEQKPIEMGQGYNRQVGLKGNQLSGGQKQRIAIARAIIKNPKILLLDEATSALDAANETIVQESLDRIMKSKTTLAIAHRISTIKDSDNIFVIEDGNLVEQGNYNQLQQNKGYFYRLERGEQH